MPPVSILDEDQAQYHFLCGFTSKLAGTERGITEPQPSFSPAFGEAFLTLHPTMYSKTLVAKMKEHNAKAYLVNTGWNGTGKRISLKNTRAIIDAIIDGSIEKAETVKIPFLNLTAPKTLAKVDDILDPRTTYKDAVSYTHLDVYKRQRKRRSYHSAPLRAIRLRRVRKPARNGMPR